MGVIPVQAARFTLRSNIYLSIGFLIYNLSMNSDTIYEG